MNPDPPARDEVRVERVLPAPIDDVFAAWTEPASMAGWLSPTGRASVEADVRVGGRFRVVMLGHDTAIEHTGEYLELEPPRRLSFTWRSEYTGDGPSVVTVTLAPYGDDTRLTLVHAKLPGDVVTSHGEGWTSILDNLALALETGEHQTRQGR